MVAGLMLASVGRGCDYAYVGGRQRTREGTGVVISGAENLRSMEDPWAVYAVDEKKRLCLFIERYQFAAALEVVESLSARAGAREQQLFKHLRAIIQGYIAWERFDHKGANAPLRKGLFGLKDYLALVPAPRLADYVQGVEDNIKFLEQIKQETRNFKKDRLCSALVGDLLSNARRRAEEGKFDDAMARLYRALEMIGQIAFNDRFGCPTNNVQKECLPEAIKNEYVNRYESSDDGRIRLPLEPTFIALAEADDDVGLKYRACEKALIKILRSRNDSILAHGMIPVKEATYQELLEQISQFAGDLPMVRFPRLDLS